MGARSLAVLCLALSAAAGCRHLSLGPPALFPVVTVWVTPPLDDAIEGPLVSDGSRIFVAARDGSLRALDPAGDPVWRRDAAPGPIAAAAGVLVQRQGDGTVVSVDPATGETRWTAASGVAGSLPPVLDRDRVLVAGEGLAALDLATGRVLWAQPPPTVTTPPVARGARILTGEADGTLRCRDRATGASLWTYRTGGRLGAAPVVTDQGRVFLGTTDRRIQSLALDKGKEGWRWRVGADIQTTGAAFQDTVLFAAYDDVLYALHEGNGHLAWRAPLPSRPLSAPLLVGDSIVIACYESDVLGFSARTGKKLGGLKTPAEMRTPPLVVDDRLYVGLKDRTIVAYRLQMTPSAAEAPRATPPPGRRTQPRR